MMLTRKRLRQTVPRQYVINVMENNKSKFLQVTEIYSLMKESHKIALGVIYRVTRDLYTAGVLERRWDEYNGRLTYRLIDTIK
ncbi:transcriptional repressor [Kosakonia oryzae]|nr:transcriptional repressor [Kosakonia oryzae]